MPEQQSAVATGWVGLDSHTDFSSPGALQGQVTWFNDARDGGRHQAMAAGLSWAFREAFAGRYPARDAYTALEAAWDAAFDVPGSRRPPPTEFQGLAKWAAAQALVSDPAETLTRVDRNRSTQSADITILRASDIAEKPLRPLWDGHLYYGKLTEIIGDSETGKSLIAEADLAARVTTGAPFPGQAAAAIREPENVIITASEDGFADTGRPRLRAAGADLNRVFLFKLSVDDEGNEIPMTLPDRAGELRQVIEQVNARYGRVGYLVISPIAAYLSEHIRSQVDASVRRALMPLVRIADDLDIAVLLVRHPNKDRSMKAVDRQGNVKVCDLGVRC